MKKHSRGPGRSYPGDLLVSADNKRGEERSVMSYRFGLGLLVVALAIAGCATDPTASAEYIELAEQMAEVSQERDALATAEASDGCETATARYEKAAATQEELLAIIADPTAFGTETEVLDLLDSMAVPNVVSGDLAFGGTRTGLWRVGWKNTLFGSDDMSVKTWRSWLSEDGSVGGSLWTWYGVAGNGEEFAIPGVEVSRFNEEGLFTEVVMFYPFEDAEVHRRVREGN